jgi:hypothetical protein
VLTVAAMWSRPTRSAPPTSAAMPAVGLAWCNSATREAWDMVTSSRTPRPPMMMPASSSPRSDSPPTTKLAPRASSLASPVRAAAATKAMARAAVRPRARAVPTTAAVVLGPVPWER